MVVAPSQTPPSPADDDNRASQSIHRVRSQNGYGVDDAAPEDDVEQHHGQTDKDEFEVSWDGGDSDPLCPRSFGKARKWMITLIAVTASFCVTCASSIYTSTYQQLEAEFHNSRIVSVLGLSSFVLGISLGPMFFGPLSEFYGRRPIYIVSWSLYVIWIIPQAVCQNIQTMIVSRFFNAFAGSTFLAVSGGTVGDLFAQHELPAPMALFTIAPFIGPSVGPLIGGFINYYTDWRWTFYVLLIWAFVLLVAIAVLVPETYHPIILRKKAQKMREQTGDDRWHGPGEKVQRSVLTAVGLSLLRPFQLLTFEFMVLNLCIYSAILLGILYLFFGVFPLVFRENNGFNLWQVGFTFVGLGVGMVAGVMTYPLWHRVRMQLIAKTEQGQSEPEFRLPPVIMGSFLVPIGLFMFGWTTFPSVHWIVPIIGSAIFGAGTTMSYSGIFTFLVDAYPAYAASALAANTFVRCLFATAFPLFGNQMFETLGYPWATSLLGFLTVAMMPFPYLFFRYGKKWRAKSRYAKS
ncbi:major facilitator superfamily domain-containing protein [Stachybotrys elegans]|uniref:Major facilitator superfamily domain-containing protein n=1 Tax=Stachybotrys elegans TaxID=80388 RepID=A0A8K0SKS0_9HYPO|nr:major facilitator superfamily domain-containing protein [Stachybotrys elegans]